jgi:hypothetical protein
MALGVGDTSSSGLVSSVSSITFSHDVSGSNTAIIVMTSCADSVQADRDVSSVTYNADALTEKRQDDDAANVQGTTIWRRIAPDSGTHNVVVTFGGTISLGAAGAITFTGADQTEPVDVVTGDNAANEDPLSTSITTITDNSYVVDCCAYVFGGGNALAVGGTQTEVYNVELNTSRDSGGSYEGPVTPAGAQAMVWDSASGVGNGCHSLVTVKPTGAATTGIMTTNTGFWGGV